MACFIGAVLMLWDRLGEAPADALTATPTGIAAPAEPATDTAIRDTLTRYNAAETEAAALLTIEPLRPFLDPCGPFATRRASELAERQRRSAPHRSLLVRWAIGAIKVNGDSATVSHTGNLEQPGGGSHRTRTGDGACYLHAALGHNGEGVADSGECADAVVTGSVAPKSHLKPFAIMCSDQKAFLMNRPRVWLVIPIQAYSLLSLISLSRAMMLLRLIGMSSTRRAATIFIPAISLVLESQLVPVLE